MTPAKILIADDDQIVRYLLTENLTARGFSISLVENGSQVLEALRMHCPDIIILDVMMPEMDGWEVCKAIRDECDLSHVKIIFLTARASERDKMIGLDILKADRYMTKPFEIDELLTHIRELLHV